MKRLMAMVIALSSGAFATAGQDGKKAAKPDPLQLRVDAAIQDGVEYLRSAPSPGFAEGWIKLPNSDELILLTLIHAGVPEGDPKVQELLKNVLEAPLEWNYSVALQAIALEEIHRVRYQARIAECAQFLVDTQCPNGQWTYGEKIPRPVPTGKVRRSVATSGKTAPKRDPKGSGRREKPAVVQTIEIKKTRDNARPSGDNSNSMYAALGLRAAFDAGVRAPQETIARAAQWWRDNQMPVRGDKPGRGWGYQWVGVMDYGPIGSITCGALGSLVIYDYMQGADWRADKAVQEGMKWLENNFTVTENPGPPSPGPKVGYYYYLYALERFGILFGTETIGRHAWYLEGAKVIVDDQKPDGSWNGTSWPRGPVYDTCFAILFLRRATAPLPPVASVDPIRAK